MLHYSSLMSDRTASHINMRNASGSLPACFVYVRIGVCNPVTVPLHKVASDSHLNNDLKMHLKNSTVLFFHAVSVINTVPLWSLPSIFFLTLYLQPTIVLPQKQLFILSLVFYSQKPCQPLRLVRLKSCS